jgi:hypothetical protein
MPLRPFRRAGRHDPHARSYRCRLRQVFALSLGPILLGGHAALGLAASAGSQQPLAIQQRNALNAGGLRAAAKITGSYVSIERGPEGVIRTLDARTEWSGFSFTHPARGQPAVFFIGPLSANERPHPDRMDMRGQPKAVYGVTATYYVFELGKFVLPAAVWPNDAAAACRADSPLVIWARCQSSDQFLAELAKAIQRAG